MSSAILANQDLKADAILMMAVVICCMWTSLITTRSERDPCELGSRAIL